MEVLEETFDAKVIQYLLPDGRAKNCVVRLPIEFNTYYECMLSYNCRLESEILSTGEVSVTVSNEEGDVDFSITRNGPEVSTGIQNMLQRKRWILRDSKGRCW